MNNRSVSVIIKALKGTSQKNVITLPNTILYQINRYYGVRLKAGAEEFEVSCIPNNTQNIIEIPIPLIHSMGLMSEQTINLFVRDNIITLGPLIGIFISNGQVKKAICQAPNFRFIETAKANKEARAVLYYFSIKDVDFEKKRILGTWFNYETNQWELKDFPYPDVLYDRGGGTLQSQQRISNYIREEFNKNRGLKRVNPKYFFNKWEVHRELIRYEEMGMYLPYTILFTRKEDLIHMLEKHGTVYVKDTQGNNGKGVARIIKLSENEYEMSHFLGSTLSYKFSTLLDMFNKVNEIFENKDLIVQGAIDVLQVEGRNADMRATIQRDGNGELNITALPVRLGMEGCPITTTRSGAAVYKLEDFFSKYFSFSDEQIRNLREGISYFLMRCFLVIEDIYGQFGELGIDYAIDKNMKIWFIECNAKPGKDTLYLSYDDNTIKKAFLNPLEYAKYLWSNSTPYQF